MIVSESSGDFDGKSRKERAKVEKIVERRKLAPTALAEREGRKWQLRRGVVSGPSSGSQRRKTPSQSTNPSLLDNPPQTISSTPLQPKLIASSFRRRPYPQKNENSSNHIELNYSNQSKLSSNESGKVVEDGRKMLLGGNLVSTLRRGRNSRGY